MLQVQLYHVKQTTHCYYTRVLKSQLHLQSIYCTNCSIINLVSNRCKEHGREADIDLLRELAKVTAAIEAIVDDAPIMEQIAADFLETTRNAFFIGRTIDYNVKFRRCVKT